jgi:hypothetical protein
MPTPPTSLEALRTRRQQLLASLTVPPEGLPGSLALSHPRCGSPTCHCQTDPQGHPAWTLTFMVAGTKRVVHIPHAEVEDIRRRVHAGNHFKAAVAEILAINAQLMVLERPARPRRASATRRTR